MADELKPIENHCPFGCPDENLDELGYCEHLIGFSSPADKDQVRRLEPVVLRRRFNRESKEWVEDGTVMVDGREPEAVQEGDVLVNPEFDQADDHGVWHKAKKWVSERVYSEDPDRRPIPVEIIRKQVVRRQMSTPAVRARAGMKPAVVDREEKPAAPAKQQEKPKAPARPRDAKGRLMKAKPTPASDEDITSDLNEAVRSES